MNRIVNNVRLFAGINLVGLTSLAMAARFHQDVPPDAAPPSRTHVLHRSAPVAVQEDHGVTGGATTGNTVSYASVSATIGASCFTSVSPPAVAPTTGAPQGEEHIAVDP